MLYAIITLFTVGLLYLLSLTATIQVIFVNSDCRDSTYHQVLCILRLTLCQGVCFWFQMDGLAFCICIRWHVYQTQVTWHAEQFRTLVLRQAKICSQPCHG